jgi:hypothetical protein
MISRSSRLCSVSHASRQLKSTIAGSSASVAGRTDIREFMADFIGSFNPQPKAQASCESLTKRLN